jgi:NAD(P)-dependent dehydrogenase (short-subunit alcohol dehydrogenase family)
MAVAHALAANGHRVIVADRNARGAHAVVFYDAGALDIAVNTAGFSTVGLITELPVEDFRPVVDVCLTGSFLVIKHAASRLHDAGALASISSLNGRQPAAAMSAYCAAKARLSMLTQVAACCSCARRRG